MYDPKIYTVIDNIKTCFYKFWKCKVMFTSISWVVRFQYYHAITIKSPIMLKSGSKDDYLLKASSSVD